MAAVTPLQLKTKKVLENKIFQICEFSLITTIPVILIKVGVVPFDNVGLLSVLSATFLVASALIFIRVYYTKSWNWTQIGFTFTGMRKALPAYTMVLLGVMSLFKLAPSITETRDGFDPKYFFLYSIFGAILQDILYWSYVMKLVGDIFGEKNKHICLFFTVMVFAGMHCIFPNFDVSFIFIVIAGFIFAKLYKTYSYIILVSVVHIALNYFAYTVKLF